MSTHSSLRKIAAIGTAMLLCLVPLTACGNASSSGGDSSAKEIKIATGNEFKPFCYLDVDGNPDGYDVAILKAVDKKLPQYKFTFEPADFTTTLTNLEDGKAQIGAYEYAVNDQRKAKFVYGDVGTTIGDMYIVSDPHNGPVYQTFDDLKGKKVALTPGSNPAALAENYLKTHKDAFKIVYGTYTGEQIVQGLTSGTFDATLAAPYTLGLWNKSFNKGLKAGSKPVHKADTYILFNKSADKQLISDVNGAMKSLKTDGTFKQLSQKYLGGDYVPA